MNSGILLNRWFSDYSNPTHKELTLWMQDPESFEPMQDWDLIVGTEHRLLSLVKLASIDGVQREYIVHYLHVSTANAFYHDRNQISEGLRLVPEDTFTDLREWCQKAEDLLKNPSSFREHEWYDYIHNR